MADGMALAQGAVERLAEDEALRGDLTDDGFKSLLDWATNALIAAAAEIAAEPDEATQTRRMDEAETAIRRVLAKLLDAAQRHGRAEIAALMNDPLVARFPLARVRLAANGWRLGDDVDKNAIRLAGALRGVRP